MRFFPFLFLVTIIGFSFFSCNKTETFQTEALSDYIPLQPGKYITYRVDSTVFTNFGTVTEIHSYLVKHVMDAQIPDNLGRPSYRVFRFITDTTGTQPWVSNGTYFITPLADRTELIEDNLRFIKLHLPIRISEDWKGNSYLPSDTYSPQYSFSNDDEMQDWDFYYASADSALNYNGQNYSNVYTVEEDNESFNVPITNANSYAYINRAVEKYSRTIGLVYREYTMWEYQPNPSGPSGYKVGFGVKMWMVDHN